MGRRITVNGNHIAYIGGSNLAAYETNASNGVISRFVYNSAGLPVLWNYNGKEYGYVYDGLGNIVGLVDDTSSDSTYGTEVVKYTYDAWGNVLTHTDSTNTGLDTANPFIYRGYWYDWDTGLYYLNARYYNPRIGRFLSKDPVGPTFGDVESYNSFSYARSNPLTIADPAGKTVNLTNALLVVGTVVVIGGLVVTTGGLASVVGMAVSTSTADLVLGGIVVAGLGLAGYEFANNHGRIVNPPKSQSPIWQGLQNHKNGTKTSGSGKDKRYYQWDNTHNDIEVYDHKGKHIGSMDPTTGEMYKPPVPGRRIQPI